MYALGYLRKKKPSAAPEFPPRFVARQICYVPGCGVVYLQNPKVGCTSIRESLWMHADTLFGRHTYAGDPFQSKDSPFCRSLASIAASGLDTFFTSRFFSIVRNPYTRVLSAYLNKIASPDREMRVWLPIAQRYGWEIEQTPAFLEVLTAISTDDTLSLDHHFRPQHLNLLHPYAPLDFVGRIECMGEVEAFLRGSGIVLRRAVKHGTDAGSKLAAHLGPAETRLAAAIYARDFEIYGYDEDPAAPPPVGGVGCEAATREPFRRLFMAELQRERPKPKPPKAIIRPPYWKVPWRVIKRMGFPPPSRERQPGPF